MSGDNSIRWEKRWENEVQPAEHAELARLFVRAYPRHAETFSSGQSWSGARPELRIVAWDGGRPVAHLGVLRRFLRWPSTDTFLLVGDVGLVAVDPDFQGQGLGTELLVRVRALMAALELKFGFLTCREQVVPFYRSGGWEQIEGLTTRMIDNRQNNEDYTGPAMVLPVGPSSADWPVGPVVDRNGWEV